MIMCEHICIWCKVISRNTAVLLCQDKSVIAIWLECNFRWTVKRIDGAGTSQTHIVDPQVTLGHQHSWIGITALRNMCTGLENKVIGQTYCYEAIKKSFDFCAWTTCTTSKIWTKIPVPNERGAWLHGRRKKRSANEYLYSKEVSGSSFLGQKNTSKCSTTDRFYDFKVINWSAILDWMDRTCAQATNNIFFFIHYSARWINLVHINRIT